MTHSLVLKHDVKNPSPSPSQIKDAFGVLFFHLDIDNTPPFVIQYIYQSFCKF